MKVPFNDLQTLHASQATEIQEAINSTIASCAFINGPNAAAFETDFAQYTGAKFCVGLGNGTDALILALRALGIADGDEVIVPAHTFIATSEAVTTAGGTVVFADIDKDSGLIDLNDVQQKITSRTKAIIPVHLYGNPVDISALRPIADKHKLHIVQDSAQSHGALLHNQQLVDFGDICAYSFYPGKNLGAMGDAGCVVTNNQELANTIRKMANHGRLDKYNHQIEGYNSRLDGLQAAVLRVKLKNLATWTSQRIHVANYYDNGLRDISEISLPYRTPDAKHVFHLYTIRTQKRDALLEHLKADNISAGIHYPISLPYLEAYKHLNYSPEDFPVAYQWQKTILSLPLFPTLTDKQCDYVIQSIKRFFN